jgi:hypothetical protein
MVLVQTPVEGSETGETSDSMEMKNFGCENDRRDGSAYCQECSDKYNKEYAEHTHQTVDLPEVLDSQSEAQAEQQ